MSIYSKNGNQLSVAYSINDILNNAYNINGEIVFSKGSGQPDYSDYSYIVKWASKGIDNTQGFDIYDNKIFWVSKSGDSSVPANCYVWNLSDGTQAFNDAYVTIYSGHGNSLDIIGQKAYAGTAYSPATAYENAVSVDLQTFTLSKTFDLSEDATYGHDICIDETDIDIMWSLAHTGAISETSAPFLLSKWDLTDLTNNGDGTYSPKLLYSVQTPQPPNSAYFQGVTMHDGMIWYASGYPGSSAYVYAINPDTGVVLYSIDCNTTAEPEGVAWAADSEVVGGYALYVGFQGMMLRKYTFAELQYE